MLPRFAWFLTLVSGVCAAADTWITVASRPLNSERTLAVHGWPLVTLATVGASAMGALIISRYPRHPIGWLFCVVGVTSAMSMVTEAFAMWHAADGRPGSMALANVAAWISTVFGGASSLTGLTLIFLLVPDGHLLSRRWRYVAWTSVAGFATFLASLVLIDPTSYTIIEPENASATAASLSTIGFLLITVAMVASVTSLVIRFRRSRGRTRQQLRLIVVAGSLVAVGLATLLVVQLFNGGKQTWAAGLPLFVSY
ncbi:MAG TPA: hypothetical protein VH419_14900, partial [Nocardioidaceae bacterium]